MKKPLVFAVLIGLILFGISAAGAMPSAGFFSWFSLKDFLSNLPPSQLATNIFILVAFIFLLVFGGIFFWIIRPIVRQKRILKTGLQARATILEVWQTGVVLNGVKTQIALRLRVIRPDMSPYEVKTKMFCPIMSAGNYQQGMEVQIKVDRNNKNLVAVVPIDKPGAINITIDDNHNGIPDFAEDMIKNAMDGTAKAQSSMTFVVDGKQYSSIAELPPDARRKLEEKVGKLIA
jgi:hypothetical protein